MKKTIIIVGILFTIATGLHAVVWGNGVCKLFDACTSTGSGTSEKSNLSSSSISMLEVQAASFFYSSQQGYKEFLQMVERSYTGTQLMDTGSLLVKLNAVYSSIDGTLTAYHAILQKVTTLPMHQSIYYSLQAFDYQGFCEERGLIPSIFLEVEELLKGEPASVCQYIINKSTEIRNQLSLMRAKYSARQLVEMSDIWKVNQKFNHLDNVGQYIAMVLGSI